MPEQVLEANQISLNGELYQITGPVRSSLTSNYPPKVIQGDVTQDSQQYASVASWGNWSGGFGKDRIEKEEDFNRAWLRSTCQLRYPGHLAPTFAVTTTTNPSIAGTVTTIGELGNAIYATFGGGNDVRKYADGSTWGSSLKTLTGNATDVVTVTLAGGTFMVHAYTTGYDYTSDGSSWPATQTIDTKYLTTWDDRLWGIDNAGQLWSASVITSQTLEGVLRLPTGSVNSLFTGPDATGEEIIYAGTDVGLYAYDASTAEFHKTGLVWPRHVVGNHVGTTWRGDIYLPVGQSVFRYVPGSTAQVFFVGPDADGSMADTYAGEISRLIPGFAGLIALVDDSDGNSSILEYTGQGWQVLWEGNNNITTGYIGSAYGSYRIWFTEAETNADVLFIKVPTSLTVPGQTTSFNYTGTTVHNTPWFTAGELGVNKLALTLDVESLNMTANDTCAISYLLNYDDTTTVSLGTISSNGLTTYTFGDDANTPNGVAFRAIRFQLTFTTAAGTTKPPDIRDLSLRYRKKLTSKWGHRVRVKVSGDYGGNDPMTQFTNIRTAVSSNQLVEFTFRPDATAGAAERFYVDVHTPVTSELTGTNFEGEIELFLVAP
jgi:hypothetical protein